MLGDELGSDIGQITGTRVLPAEGGIPRADGNLAGEGQGIVRTDDGEMATWTGTGVGRVGPGGKVEARLREWK